MKPIHYKDWWVLHSALSSWNLQLSTDWLITQWPLPKIPSSVTYSFSVFHSCFNTCFFLFFAFIHMLWFPGQAKVDNQVVTECVNVFQTLFRSTYIVEQFSPALHGDTLEDGENSKQDVVKLGDSIVWSQPVLSTHGAVWTQPWRRLCPTWKLLSDLT